MALKRKYSVSVIPDDDVETFSKSLCSCKNCTLMHISQTEWDTFTPETKLQKRMKATIDSIENKIQNGWKSNITEIPKRLKNNKRNKHSKS